MDANGEENSEVGKLGGNKRKGAGEAEGFNH